MQNYKGGGNPDRNQAKMIDLARRMGCSVVVVSVVPKFVDAVVGCCGRTELWEIKKAGWSNYTKRGKIRKLTKSEQNQQRFRATWRGGLVRTILTGRDVVIAVQVMVSATPGPAGCKKPLTGRELKALGEELDKEGLSVDYPF